MCVDMQKKGKGNEKKEEEEDAEEAEYEKEKITKLLEMKKTMKMN
jgi:hypothetical protein